MTLVKFNNRPFATGFNNLLDEMLSDWPAGRFNNSERKAFVPVNVKETEKGYQLDVIAPGFEKADINISLENNLLTISAEHKTEKTEGEKEIRREYSYRSFKRSFTIDEKIDATKIEASYINGVLTLNLPAREAVKPQATSIAVN